MTGRVRRGVGVGNRSGVGVGGGSETEKEAKKPDCNQWL